VTQFRLNRHGWGGEGLPVAVDAGTSVEDAVAAYAAVDRVMGSHQPAAVGVSPVDYIGLPGASRTQLGQHDVTFRVIRAGAGDLPQGGGAGSIGSAVSLAG
jgi:hypothetical protein